jgi:hypothetical protein
LLPWRPVTSAAHTAGREVRATGVGAAKAILVFLVLMVAYEWARDLVAPAVDARAPYEHADQIIDAQRAMGLFIEPDVQRIVHDIPGGRFASTWFYTLAYTAGYVLFLGWAFLRHRPHFVFLHTWYWITNGLAVIGYWLYPLAPPRFIANIGMEDTTKAALELGGTLEWFQPFRNLYAAMPSMHVGQTLLYALAITLLVRSRWRWTAWLWPTLMLITVMATANHFWLDAVGSLICVLIALGFTRLVLRTPVPRNLARA